MRLHVPRRQSPGTLRRLFRSIMLPSCVVHPKMRRSMSASPSLIEGDKQAVNRMEKDFKKRYGIRGKVSLDQRVQTSRKLLYVGNPILRKAMERDEAAANAEKREPQFASIRTELRYFEINSMDREDVHSV